MENLTTETNYITMAQHIEITQHNWIIQNIFLSLYKLQYIEPYCIFFLHRFIYHAEEVDRIPLVVRCTRYNIMW